MSPSILLLLEYRYAYLFDTFVLLMVEAHVGFAFMVLKYHSPARGNGRKGRGEEVIVLTWLW